MQDNLAATMTSVSCGTAAAAIVANPVNVTVRPGEPATFSTSATGPGQLTYQWRKDGVPIAGATSTNFTIGSVGSADLGTYDVLVTKPLRRCGVWYGRAQFSSGVAAQHHRQPV